MLKVIRRIRKIAGRIIRNSFYFFPIKDNKIVFQNFLGKGYGDNPKYIAEEIINESLNYDLVWLCNNMDENMPDAIRKIRYGSLRAFYEMTTAKVWIDNVRNGVRPSKKRKGQYYIQTWHGGLALKKIEKAVEKKLDQEYVKCAKKDSKITNLMLSDSKWMTQQYYKSFWYNGEVLEKGLPRKDVLFQSSNVIQEKVYEYFDIKSSYKIILYAPTFRKNSDTKVYLFDYEKCCRVCEERFGDKYVILIRLHPNVAQDSQFIQISQHVNNASFYPDMQELLIASDILITDYSSSVFEFSIASKKAFIFATDLENYLKEERAFNFELQELPFPLCKSEKQLYDNISNFDQERYSNDINQFYNTVGMVKTDKASYEVVQRIREVIGS